MIHAVIIAGGRGERLGGVCKAELRVGGRRLIDRVTSALGPVQSPIMIATGPNPSRYEHNVGDLAGSVGGPLAGLAAAVSALRDRDVRSGILISVAVDTPFLPENFVTHMCQALGDAAAAYAAFGDNFYPPNAAWRIEALQDLPERVVIPAGPGSLKSLQKGLGAIAVAWSRRCELDPFANLNTLADLLALGRRARG